MVVWAVTQREEDIERFYVLLKRLEERVGGKRRLGKRSGRMKWPRRGVYFFFEEGECRKNPSDGLRVVRVGTHALKRGAKSRLWGRLSQHRGVLKHGGGYHGHSIFRYHVGLALAKRDDRPKPESWKKHKSDCDLERRVSEHIRNMPLLWLNVPDAPRPESQRGCIEANAIQLLTDTSGYFADSPSRTWLGHYSQNQRIRNSGMWNAVHTGEQKYDPSFLDIMRDCIENTEQT